MSDLLTGPTRRKHSLYRRLLWNPLIVAVLLAYLGSTAYYAGFPAGRTIGAGIIALWFVLSTVDSLSGHRLLDLMYSEDK